MIYQKQTTPILQLQGIYLRLIQKSDIPMYYETGFAHPDAKVNYFTGTTQTFTRNEIEEYVMRIVDDDTRYDFLIFDEKDNLLGEAVLNEIDWTGRMAGFRIALFSLKQTEKGIGKQVVKAVTEFALHTLQLHRIELEVFDFNPRAQHVYETCGFQVEGRKKDALYLNGTYHDILMMALLEQA